MAQMKCGGTSDVKQATQEIQSFCEELRVEILQKSGKDSTSGCKAISYTSQLVAGTNYFVKIQVGNTEEYIHARIYQPLPHTGGKRELHSVQTDKQLEDALEYF